MNDSQRGFTLVELIVTLIVVTILSVVAISRFVGRDAFSGTDVQFSLLSELHYAQQLALAGQNQCSLTFSSDGFWLPGNCGSPERQASQTRCDSGATISNGLCSNNVAITLSGNQSFALTFDSLGRVTQCRASGCQLQVSGLETLNLCIETEGFIHEC
ncbi:pilus assembly FimT family protein [Ferrimonas aestuarii]|uniref:pilus assembly FimT family protein n=1 Tax=Ferrimonas aestuarii TaxID=2569539 RepID=UPI00145D6561|nr:type II secretion system protein [Ferrimonas aestuarii]